MLTMMLLFMWAPIFGVYEFVVDNISYSFTCDDNESEATVVRFALSALMFVLSRKAIATWRQKAIAAIQQRWPDKNLPNVGASEWKNRRKPGMKIEEEQAPDIELPGNDEPPPNKKHANGGG
jgi:hypothetical protein